MAHALCVLDNWGHRLHLEYVILVAFTRQQWLRGRTLLLRSAYIVHLIKFSHRCGWGVRFSGAWRRVPGLLIPEISRQGLDLVLKGLSNFLVGQVTQWCSVVSQNKSHLKFHFILSHELDEILTVASTLVASYQLLSCPWKRDLW
jgi:hypothetical protein